MRIVEKQSALLSNEEVLLHVKQIAADNAKNRDFTATKTETKADGTKFETASGKLRELKSVCDVMIDFFAGQDSALRAEAKRVVKPCGSSHRLRTVDVLEQAMSARMEELKRKLASFKLTSAECLMLANHRPRSESVLLALVEEADHRLSPEQQAAVIRVVAEVFGVPDK